MCFLETKIVLPDFLYDPSYCYFLLQPRVQTLKIFHLNVKILFIRLGPKRNSNMYYYQ